MLGIVGSLVRFCFLTVAVLLLSQIPIKSKRICDHVGDWVSGIGFDAKKPIAWIGDNFKFTQTKSTGTKVSTVGRNHDPDTEITDPDRAALSGLLKTISKK